MSYSLTQGDCKDVLKTLADQSVQCCVTSPPYYGLRDYGTASWQGEEEINFKLVNQLFYGMSKGVQS